MKLNQRQAIGLCALFFAASLIGCDAKSRPATVDSKYLLQEAPDAWQSVSAAKAGIEDTGSVTILGRINAGEHPAFEPGKAIFVVQSEPENHDDDGEGHDEDGHDPSTCPFCKKSNSPVDTRAIVKIFDENGELVLTDARELLGLQQDDVVIVQGEAEIDPLGYLVVAAKGIFIKK